MQLPEVLEHARVAMPGVVMAGYFPSRIQLVDAGQELLVASITVYAYSMLCLNLPRLCACHALALCWHLKAPCDQALLLTKGSDHQKTVHM